jgi:acyl-CoA synthetase (AMP-forming)/AMP-acid ligase II
MQLLQAYLTLLSNTFQTFLLFLRFTIMMFYLLLGISSLVFAVRHLLSRRRSVQNLRSVHIANETDENLAEVEGSLWPQLSVFQHVERGLKRNPDKAAVICLMEQSVNIQKLVATCSKESELQRQEPNSFTLTYAQLHCTALKLAIGLLDIGVQPNTRMMMLIPNGAEYTILLWACLLLRITYVNIDPIFLDTPDFTALKQRLQKIKPQLVVIPDARHGKAIDTATSELGLPQPVKICLSSTVSVPTVWRTLVDVASRANSQDLMDEVSLLSAARCDDSTRINSIMFTSGTSGVPKACPQTVGAISHALHSQEWLIDPDSGVAKYALMQPHNSRGIAPAQTLQTWRAGGTVVLTGQTFR